MAEGSPVPLAQKPYDAMLAPGWITFDQSAGVTVAEVPLRTAVPLGADPIVCNTNRPRTAHGDQTPAEFAPAWTIINELLEVS